MAACTLAISSFIVWFLVVVYSRIVGWLLCMCFSEKRIPSQIFLFFHFICALNFVYSSGCLYKYIDLAMQSQLLILIPAL